MTHLWSSNTPKRFWQCEPDPPAEQWREAVCRALPVLGMPTDDLDEALRLTLGEAQFGANRWEIGTVKRAYYWIKPLLPSPLRRGIRRASARRTVTFPLGYPAEPRYVRFQQEALRQLLLIRGESSIRMRPLWRENRTFALVLTHDIETAEGQRYVSAVADVEERLSFRSSFNFVPERYPLDYGLMHDLRERGFEIAIHGLKHDGRDFASQREFARRAPRINRALAALDAVGFAAPLSLRQPEWMQTLDIAYDRSSFDTDPYEPLAGGVMTIHPFQAGRYIELPYTLPQDYTLTTILGERTPRLWLEKAAYLKANHGMALLVTHPDYLKQAYVMQIYSEFLQTMRDDGTYWHALPREVACWWRDRTGEASTIPATAQAVLRGDSLEIAPASAVDARLSA